MEKPGAFVRPDGAVGVIDPLQGASPASRAQRPAILRDHWPLPAGGEQAFMVDICVARPDADPVRQHPYPRSSVSDSSMWPPAQARRPNLDQRLMTMTWANARTIGGQQV